MRWNKNEMELNVNLKMLVVILILTLTIVIHVMDNDVYLYRLVLFEFINLRVELRMQLVFNHLIGVNDRIGFNYDNELVKIENVNMILVSCLMDMIIHQYLLLLLK